MESFVFSVIMAVYNTEAFLEEAVESLIHQTCGLDKLQIILVDDGSTDRSGEICDRYQKEYPQNVLALHKPNGGQSSARNLGVKYAKGRYLNFMDSDDRMDLNAFEAVYRFIQQHEGETDVISIPMVFFGSHEGQQALNSKFRDGTRVIDLTKEWKCIQLAVNCAFIRADAVRKYAFNEDLHMAHAEDAREVNKILIHKPKLGVVADTAYRYRKWGGSTLDAAAKNKNAYMDYIANFSLFVLRYALEEIHRIPRFIQYTVLYDLQWKIRQQRIPDGVLTDEEKQQYFELIRKTFQYIDDDVFSTYVGLFVEHKLLVWKMKYGREIPTDFQPGALKLILSEDRVVQLENCLCKLEFFSLKQNSCTIEGYFTQVYDLDNPPEIALYANGQKYPCVLKQETEEIYGLDQLIAKRIFFKCEFPVSPRHTEFYFTVCFGGAEARLTNLSCGPFFPISRALDRSLYTQDGKMLRWNKKTRCMELCPAAGALMQELLLYKELWVRNREGYRKAILARMAAHAMRLFKRKPLLLLSDRFVAAGDNGEAMFRYLQDKPEINSWFVIKKDSADYDRMAKVGKVVPYRSFRHKLLMLASDIVVSSHVDEDVMNPFNGHDNPYHDFRAKRKFVFLQHGITKDDISGWVKRRNKNLAGFIAAAIPEYDSFVHGKYDYPEKNIWLTGFPRFDSLEDRAEKIVYIMPTWRKNLMDGLDTETGVWRLGKKFEQSEYLRYYSQLLSDERLNAAAKQYGYRIVFFPHPNLQPFEAMFARGEQVSVLPPYSSYNEVYRTGALLLTDYSSAVFDFAYMHKPVLYTQFDRDEFFRGEHVYTKGYFDYERDGFGEVEYDVAGTVDRIVEYMRNGCRMKDEYRRRVDAFFAYHDKNNCRRVYEKLKELL